MNLSARRRALTFLGVGVVLTLLYYFFQSTPDSAPAPVAAAAADSVPQAEKKLARLRDDAATVPQKDAILKKLSADLALREKGLITAGTAQQAQAQLIQIMRRLCHDEAPPIELRTTELGPMSSLGDAFGQVELTVQFECRIEQLVNLLADLAAAPELVTPTALRVTSAGAKEKTVGVRLTVSGMVPGSLIPAKKGAS